MSDEAAKLIAANFLFKDAGAWLRCAISKECNGLAKKLKLSKENVGLCCNPSVKQGGVSGILTAKEKAEHSQDYKPMLALAFRWTLLNSATGVESAEIDAHMLGYTKAGEAGEPRQSSGSGGRASGSTNWAGLCPELTDAIEDQMNARGTVAKRNGEKTFPSCTDEDITSIANEAWEVIGTGSKEVSENARAMGKAKWQGSERLSSYIKNAWTHNFSDLRESYFP